MILRPEIREELNKLNKIQDGAGKVIVLVEDNLDNCEVTKILLEAAGFEVITFSTGEPALEYLNRAGDHIDAVILDLSLPTLDGLTIAEEIRLNEASFNRKTVPLAFYTAYYHTTGGAVERIAKKCAVERIFEKGDIKTTLSDKIKSWLENRESELAAAALAAVETADSSPAPSATEMSATATEAAVAATEAARVATEAAQAFTEVAAAEAEQEAQKAELENLEKTSEESSL